MKICDYILTDYIFLNQSFPDKDAVLRFVADTCVEKGVIKNADLLYEGLEGREQTMSTGVGGGLAFPHTTNSEAQDAAVFLIGMKQPIDFDALDNRPVDTIFSLVVPDSKTTLHIRLLARISRLCKNHDFLDAVRKADSSGKLWARIKEIEEKTAFH